MFFYPQTEAERQVEAEERAQKHDAELAALRKDAERYRFLKRLSVGWLLNYMKQAWKDDGLNMDEAIDLEMQKCNPQIGRNPRTGERV